MRKNIVNILRIIIAIAIFAALMFIMYRKFSGDDNKRNTKSENTNIVNNANLLSEDESEKNDDLDTEEDNSAELLYKEENFNRSWYNMDIYKASCTTLSDDYFDKICFLGDSRTKGLLEYSTLPSYHGFYKVGTTAYAACVEREYTADNYYYGNVLDMIERVDFDTYYIAYGTNDLALENPEQFIENMKVIIDHIKEFHPDAIIYVENILPMGKAFADANPKFTNGRAKGYNTALLNMCKEYGDLIYLDVAPCLTGLDGNAIASYTVDGLHFNSEGYQKVIDFIKKTTVEKRKDKKDE